MTYHRGSGDESDRPDESSVWSSNQPAPIETTLSLPPGCIPIRAVEVVMFLNEEGKEMHVCRWQGAGNIVSELGMVEYAKFQLIKTHYSGHGLLGEGT